MFKKDIDFNRIVELIDSMPDYFDIKRIDLTNGYSLIIEAGENQIREKEYNESLNELNEIIIALESNSKKLQKLSRNNKEG